MRQAICCALNVAASITRSDTPDLFLLSSCVTEHVLLALGFDQEKPSNAVKMPTQRDAEILDQQYAVRHCEDALTKTSIDSVSDLRFLFNSAASC